MTKDEFSFSTWFGVLQVNVLDRAGVDLKSHEVYRSDYDDGRDVYEVIEEVVAEYGESP